MSLEVLNTFGTLGTFVVIAATAVAALVQLRHMRANNQLAALKELFAVAESALMQERFAFVRDRLAEQMRDPEFRRGLERLPINRVEHIELYVLDWYEQLGILIKRGLLDTDSFCDLESHRVDSVWRMLAPTIAILRRHHGQSVYENFELLTTVCRAWMQRHRSGTYPHGVERIPLPEIAD